MDSVTSEVCIVPTHQIGDTIEFSALSTTAASTATSSSTTTTTAVAATAATTSQNSAGKKPSYLNLACCVNGYSSLTTYDSKIRQDINKSREVSPIRPSSNSIQYCRKKDSLTPPVLLPMSNAPINSQPTKHINTGRLNDLMESSGRDQNQNQNGHNVAGGAHDQTDGQNCHTSFIMQRVERLYGPGALAQGFYSPKTLRGSPRTARVVREASKPEMSELSRKFQQLSPSKRVNIVPNNLSRHTTPPPATLTAADVLTSPNSNVDLPVMRHLSEEFRAQLPAISSKRDFFRKSMDIDEDQVDHKTLPVDNITTTISTTLQQQTRESLKPQQLKADIIECTNQKITPTTHTVEANGGDVGNKNINNSSNSTVAKDGYYFLKLLAEEQARLLSLAKVAENYIEMLSSNPEISEDTMGFLRSASGKARLLVTQKMKQFEGLCHNNLKSSPDDKFPTTVDDLQGFWDMVNLQIDHINSIFEDVEQLKSNDWKKPKNFDETPAKTSMAKPQKMNKTRNPIKANGSTNVGNNSNGNATPSAAALKREAQRKQLQEMKRKNRMAMTTNSTTTTTTASSATHDPVGSDLKDSAADVNSIEIFVRDNSHLVPN